MHVFRIQLLENGREPGHIREHDGHDLALPFDGAPGGQDLFNQVLGAVGMWLLIINLGRLLAVWHSSVAAFATELRS